MCLDLKKIRMPIRNLLKNRNGENGDDHSDKDMEKLFYRYERLIKRHMRYL